MRLYPLIAALALLAPAPALAQSRSSDKLPPANPLPYEDADSAAVMAPIDRMFAALAAHDAAAILAQTRGEGGATVAVEKADGSRAVRHLSWADFAAGIKPGPDKYEERIARPAIEIDGDIAMVWAPYVFHLNGKADHCGVDLFDLVRENGSWKIVNVTWSQRSTGCASQ